MSLPTSDQDCSRGLQHALWHLIAILGSGRKEANNAAPVMIAGVVLGPGSHGLMMAVAQLLPFLTACVWQTQSHVKMAV